MSIEIPKVRPILFISHSLHEDAHKLAWLDEIRNTLITAQDENEPLCSEVIIDNSWLKDSTDWKPKLLRGLSLCHSAIIILNKKAVCGSHWVPKELTILRFRSLTQNFQLRIVTVEEWDDEMKDCFKKGDWEPLSFAAVQSGYIQQAGDITDNAHSLLKDWCQTPLDYFVSAIMTDLENIIASKQRLQKWAQIVCLLKRDQYLPLSQELWGQDHMAALLIAISTHDKFIKLVKLLTTGLTTSKKNDCGEFLKTLLVQTSSNWLDHSDIVMICHALNPGNGEPRLIAVNSAFPDFSVPCYLRKAICEYDIFHSFNLFDLNSITTSENLLDMIKIALQDNIPELNQASDEDQIKKALYEDFEDGHPWVLKIDITLLDQDNLVEKIQTAFPFLVVFAFCGEDIYPQHDSHFLPFLSPNKELTAREHFKRAERSLTNWRQQ